MLCVAVSSLKPLKPHQLILPCLPLTPSITVPVHVTPAGTSCLSYHSTPLGPTVLIRPQHPCHRCAPSPAPLCQCPLPPTRSLAPTIEKHQPALTWPLLSEHPSACILAHCHLHTIQPPPLNNTTQQPPLHTHLGLCCVSCLSALLLAQLQAIVLLVPLLEGGGINLDDGVLHKGLGTHLAGR